MNTKPYGSHNQPRFRATYKGETIGWYDSQQEARQAIARAKKKEQKEDHLFRQWLYNKGK
jgi:hypothetical protein